MDKLKIADSVNNVIMSKQLGKTDANSQFIAPTEILVKFPIADGSFEREIIAFDSSGKERTFILAIRRAGRYHKPVLRKLDWHKYVKDHGLVEGGGIVFYTTEESPDRIEVRGLIKAPVQVMGDITWVRV